MNQIIKKLFLFTVILTLSAQIFSMEKNESKIAIEEPAQVTNRLREQFKHYNVTVSDHICQKLTSLLELSKSLSIEIYNNEIIDINEFLEQVDDMLNIIPNHLEDFTLGIISKILKTICSDLASSSFILPKSRLHNLIDRTVSIFVNNKIDLFEKLFEFAKNNKLDNFDKDVLSKAEENDFSIIFHKTIMKEGSYENLNDFILENFDLCIKKDTFNQTVNDFHALGQTGLNLVIQKFLRRHELFLKYPFGISTTSYRILAKLIREPSINLKTWKRTLLDLEEYIKTFKLVNPDSNYENTFMLENLNKLRQIINWREEKIKALRSKLFESIEQEDINQTQKLAHSLYAIARNFENDNGDTPLHIAIYKKQNQELIKFLLSIYPGLIFFENNQGQTPMHLAALAGPEMLKFMMDISYQIKNA